MSALLHSLRALFGSSPVPANHSSRVTTRRRAKNHQSLMNAGGDDDDDDDVFSAFDDADGGDNTQPPSPLRNTRTDATTEVSTQCAANNSVRMLDRYHQQQQPGVADGAPSSTTPLMEFFAHNVAKSNDESLGAISKNYSLAHNIISHCCEENEGRLSSLMSLKEWREARKKFLIQYLTRRLFSLEECEQEADNNIAVDDNDESESERRGDTDGGNKCDNDDDDDDDCSFFSGVLDEPFCVGTTTEHSHHDDADNSNIGDGVVEVELAIPHEEEEEEDSIQLQTQPLLMSEKCNSNLVDELTGHASSSGIKRKLGFGDTMEHGESDDDDNTSHLETQPQNHHASVLPSPRGEQQQRQQQRHWISSKKQRRAGKRGLMWDGNFQAIPHINDASTSTSPCSKLGELDLSSTSLNLSLCRILRVWDLRLTKRMDKLESPRSCVGGRDGVIICESTKKSEEARHYHPSRTIMPHEFYEDDGPLNIAYKRVFSIEVSQKNAVEDDNNDLQGHNNSTSSSIANLTMAAFHDGDAQLKRVQSRKRRHAVRRIRIYFYNKYADAMSNALRDIWGECKHISSRGRDSKLTSLMSLANVPARCIFPYLIATPSNGSPPHPHMQHYAMNPMGDDDFGVVSPFCICIGDESNLSLDVQHRLFFDCEALEMRLLVDAPSSDQDPLVDAVDGAGDSICVDFEDTVVTVTSKSVNSGGYIKNVKRSRIPKNFGQRLRWKRILDLTTVSNDVAYDGVDEAPNANMAVPVDAGVNNDGNANETIEIGPTAESAAAGVRRVRKTPGLTVTTLRELHPLLLRNNMKKLNDTVTVYGVVLGFTPPSLTSTQEWKMSIVLIDETLPLPDWALDTRNIADEDKPREMHVPSVTLLLFMKDKSKLPVIRSAGDVICCEKVVLQAWSGEPQLCSKKHVSKFVVVRSGQTSFPDHPGIDLSRAQNLWSWGQQRLSEHPTMSPNCHLSIAGLGCGSDNAEVCEPGDLTAAVTAIIAMPEHLRRRDTPRGFIRLWDGTGPSRSDSLPLDAAEIGAIQPHDPPEQVLLEIDKILGNLVESESCIEAPLTLCGRVVNAIVWEEELWNLIHKENILCVGTFVRLRNVNNAKLQTGVCNGISIHVKSSLTPLPSNAYEVKELLRGHDSRVKRGDAPNPMSAILPGRSRKGEGGDLRTINECFYNPPATFTVQFEVARILPAFIPTSSDALRNFCLKQKDGSSKFQFSLHVRDASSETDILCLGKVAEDILGITPRDVIEKSGRCEGAICKLQRIMSPGSRCRGTIRSCVKNGNTYFFMKSMSCITIAVNT